MQLLFMKKIKVTTKVSNDPKDVSHPSHIMSAYSMICFWYIDVLVPQSKIT